MKKFILFLTLTIGLFVLTLKTFAQEIVPPFELPDFSVIFASLSSLAGAVLFLTDWIKKLAKWENGKVRWLSWLLSIVLAFVGYYLKLGMFAELNYAMTAAYGLMAAFIANGFFKTATAQTVLTALSSLFSKLFTKQNQSAGS